MRKALKITLLSLLSAATLGGAVTGAFAWFTAETNLPTVNIKGNSAGAYFAYGRGTEDDPYGIATTRHLNNLAWLQYNGAFNEDYDDDGDPDHFYFELASDVNANGFCIPPIGTEDYPFIGVFNGNNYTISNLVVSNSASDYSDKPTRIEYTTDPEIVGLFGVVGELSGESYSSSINSIHDFTLKNVQVESKTANTLIGIVAGYVNGDMSDIKVSGSSTITTNGNGAKKYTDNLSDYGLVGYSTKLGTEGTYSQSISKYYDSTLDDTGTGDDWGGSIDMNTTVDRLADMRNTTLISALTTDNSTLTQAKIDSLKELNKFDVTHKYVDGEFEEDITDTTQALYGMKDAYYDSNSYCGNVLYANFSGISSSRLYLTGGQFDRNGYYQTYDYTEGYYITDGTNYLIRNNSNNIASSTTTQTIWEFENTSGSGYIRTLNNRQYYYLRNNNGTLSLTTDETLKTNWTVTTNGNNLDIISTIGTTNYKLVYDSGWKLVDNDYHLVREDHYAITGTSSGTTYYVPTSIIGNTSTSTLTRTTDDLLYFDEPSNGTQVSFTYNGQQYFLCMYATSNTYYLTTRTTAGNSGNYYALNYYTGGYVRNASRVNISGSRYYFYLRYNNGWARYRTTSNTTTAYSVTFTHIEGYDGYPNRDVHLVNTLQNDPIATHKEELIDNDPYKINFTAENTTYFPINVFSKDEYNDKNVLIGKKYEPTLKNTGYFVAGSTTNAWSTQSNASPRSIAMAKYPIACLYNSSTLSGSYSNNNDTRKFSSFKQDGILTINSSGIVNIDDDDNDFVKYEESKTTLEDKLESQSQVGGLHFVTQEDSKYGYISKDAIVDATNVSIQGTKYGVGQTKTSYQLPVYSIDFNLKRQGYINFFAGAYNGGYNTSTSTPGTSTSANCFFTLHEVIRNSSDKTKISDIKEIKGIYSDGTSTYVYSYVDGDDEVDANGNSFDNTGLTLLFDSAWIGYRDGIKSRGGSVFYFEIPVNSGEYCLGNVTDGDGCYLMYLDIGASGLEQMDIVNAYNITTTSSTFFYPSGVDFDVVGYDGDGGDSICVYIAKNKTGSVSFVVNADCDVISITDASQISTYSYQSESFGDSYIVNGNSPGALVESEVAATRVSYIKIWQTNAVVHNLTITDTLDEDGAIISSTYNLNGTNISYDNLIGTVDAMNSTRIGTIRALENVILLDRTQGTSTFNVVLPEMEWENQTLYDATLSLADGVKIEIGIETGYTLKINGTSYADGSFYPSNS